MTYALTLLSRLNKVGYKSLKITTTADGMKGAFVDTDDGQVYEVNVKPLGITLSKEAMEQPFYCVDCGVVLDDEEKADGDVCNRCYSRAQSEALAERKREESAS